MTVELIDVDDLVRFPLLTLNRAPALHAGMRVAFGESAWEVVSCETQDERSRIVLRHVRMAKPVPSAWPTVSETLPLLREAEGEVDVLWLHADDWRQAELIDASCRPAAERVLASLDARGVYARSELVNPLRDLTLDALREAFPGARWFEAVGMHGFDAMVAGGFALITAAGLLMYGRQENGKVQSLSLERGSDPALQGFCQRHSLLLVDWCHGGFVADVRYRSVLRS